MYSLTPPERSGAVDYDSIAEKRHLNARGILVSIRPVVVAAYEDYLGSRGDGSGLLPVPLDDDAAKVLRDNYRLLDNGASHQYIRDAILGRARLDLCVYCNASIVNGLDHVLPLSLYPEYAVLPQNLVPCCSRCNRMKGWNCFAKTGRSFPHPYFVELPEGGILRAYVRVEDGSVAWDFGLTRASGMEEELFSAMCNMFDLLELGRFYRQVSVPEIVDRAQSMHGQHEVGGWSQVRDYLEREAESARRRGGQNYWKTALLRALAESHEFCTDGFRHLLRG